MQQLAALLAVPARLPLPALAAGATELLLLLTHGHVLLAVGPSHKYEELKRRRLYFVVDLLSPWAALAASFRLLSPGGGVPAALWTLCALHAALHAFYIATWGTRHTDRVIRLSSVDAHKRFQGGKYGAAELAWFFIGTTFDMAVHAIMLWLLLAAGSSQVANTHGCAP